MSDKHKKQVPDPEPEPAQDPLAPAEGEPEPAQPAAEAVSDEGQQDLGAQLAVESARAEEYYQQLLRLRADFENFRRRTRQEREEWFRQAAEEIVAAMLPVLDNFERALAKPGDSLEDFLTGIRMIHRQLGEILAQQGLERIPGTGEEFDPNLHEAVARVESGEVPENTIIEELRPGYYFKGKVIRPALVKVAKPAANEENEEGE
jgi:molecular chaperone GrpE